MQKEKKEGAVLKTAKLLSFALELIAKIKIPKYNETKKEGREERGREEGKTKRANSLRSLPIPQSLACHKSQKWFSRFLPQVLSLSERSSLGEPHHRGEALVSCVGNTAPSQSRE